MGVGGLGTLPHGGVARSHRRAAPALTQMTDIQPVRTAGQSVHRQNKGNLEKEEETEGGVTLTSHSDATDTPPKR